MKDQQPNRIYTYTCLVFSHTKQQYVQCHSNLIRECIVLKHIVYGQSMNAISLADTDSTALTLFSLLLYETLVYVIKVEKLKKNNNK